MPNGDGTLSPASVPFTARLGGPAGAGQVASLVNEDGGTLGLSIPGFVSPGPGVGVQGNALTLVPTAGTTGVTAVLRATVEGLAVSFTLTGPGSLSNLAVNLALDPQSSVTANGTSSYQIARPVTQYADNGSPIVQQAPEYYLERATAADSATGAVTGGSLTTDLAVVGSAQRLTLHLDPTWLTDARRAFPIRVDVPIVSAFDAHYAATTGTVADCDQDGAMPVRDLAAGPSGTCNGRGYLKFDLSALEPGVPVVSAGLHLWSAGTATATGASVMSNASPGGLAALGTYAYQLPSWRGSSQAAAAAAAPETAPSGDGWHAWDVSAVARQWLADHRTNGGLSLVGAQSATRFSAALDTGLTALTEAPYLDVLLAPSAPSVNGAASTAGSGLSDAASCIYSTLNDCTSSIYGVSGAFGPCAGVGCLYTPGPGTATPNPTAPPVRVLAVGNALSPLNAQYLRFEDEITCANYMGVPNAESVDASGTVLNDYPASSILQQMSTTAVPIVDFVAGGCAPTTGQFEQGVANFVSALIKNSWYPTGRPIYYEIGNEPNANWNYYGGSANSYEQEFAATANAKKIKTAYDPANGVRGSGRTCTS